MDDAVRVPKSKTYAVCKTTFTACKPCPKHGTVGLPAATETSRKGLLRLSEPHDVGIAYI